MDRASSGAWAGRRSIFRGCGNILRCSRNGYRTRVTIRQIDNIPCCMCSCSIVISTRANGTSEPIRAFGSFSKCRWQRICRNRMCRCHHTSYRYGHCCKPYQYSRPQGHIPWHCSTESLMNAHVHCPGLGCKNLSTPTSDVSMSSAIEP
jgi:hypothetical protein